MKMPWPWWVTVLFAASFAVRLALAGVQQLPPTDYVAMEELGERLWQGKGYSCTCSSPEFAHIRMPGYPALLGLGQYLGFSTFFWAKVVNSLLVTLAAWLFGVFLARSGVRPVLAGVVAVVVGLFPALAYLSWHTTGEAFYALALASLLVLLTVRGRWVVLAVGAVAGLLFWFRPEGVLVLPAFVAAWWLWHRGSLVRLVVPTVVAGALVVALVLPYGWLLESLTGTFQLSAKGGKVYSQAVAAVTDMSWEEASGTERSLATDLLERPLVVVRMVVYYWALSVYFLLAQLPGWPLLLVVLVGAWVLWRQGRVPREVWAILLLAAPALAYGVLHVEERYIYPYTLVVAGAALVPMLRGRALQRGIVYKLLLLGSFAVGASITYALAERGTTPSAQQHQQLVEQTQRELQTGTVLIGRKPFVAWQAGLCSEPVRHPFSWRSLQQGRGEHLLVNEALLYSYPSAADSLATWQAQGRVHLVFGQPAGTVYHLVPPR